MYAQAKDLVGLGKYETLTPFQAWLCERVDDVADDATGDVDSFGGWYALVGRRVVTVDGQGFWSVDSHASRAEAADRFAAIAADYAAWDAEVDDV